MQIRCESGFVLKLITNVAVMFKLAFVLSLLTIPLISSAYRGFDEKSNFFRYFDPDIQLG